MYLSFIFALLFRTISCRGTAHALECQPMGVEERKRDKMFRPIRELIRPAVFCVDQWEGPALLERGLDQLVTEQLQWQNLSACAEELYKASDFA